MLRSQRQKGRQADLLHSSPPWSIKWVSAQPRLHAETLPWKIKTNQTKENWDCLDGRAARAFKSVPTAVAHWSTATSGGSDARCYTSGFCWLQALLPGVEKALDISGHSRKPTKDLSWSISCLECSKEQSSWNWRSESGWPHPSQHTEKPETEGHGGVTSWQIILRDIG